MFLYTDLVSEIIADVAAKVPAFAHLQPPRIAVAAAPRWAGSSWGNLATCIGLRADREPTFSIWIRRRSKEIVRVTPWHLRRTVDVNFAGEQCAYLILLRLPRLLEHNPFETIIHELFHIGLQFDGRHRPLRHGRLFDWNVQRLMREYLPLADPRLAELSQFKFAELHQRFGAVFARRLPAKFQPTLLLTADPPMSYEEGVERYYPGHRLERTFQVTSLQTTPESVPRNITEANCTLHMYHRSGSEEVSPYLARRFKQSESAARGPLLAGQMPQFP